MHWMLERFIPAGPLRNDMAQSFYYFFFFKFSSNSERLIRFFSDEVTLRAAD